MIIDLIEAAEQGPARVGGKAATLAVLARAGFAVPEGFVVPVGSDLEEAEIGRLGGGRFAVRSSAVAEDLPDASFAGLYETFLNVAAADVADAVRRCRASARAERVSAYRRTDGGTGDGMAVLVQRMVFSVISCDFWDGRETMRSEYVPGMSFARE
ncbi:PEP/pyruvate-binding domain-containing protein [Nonomuraea sp. NPDC049480]|uniref:PEP/pyruvate-binding domain-containing protein n=1 Tax=Nonomuraea sp. NPDC049480 TaxID=3364353 RepID=UPI003797C1D8